MSWKDEIKKQFHQDENGAWLFTEIDGDHEYTAPFKEMTASAINRYADYLNGLFKIIGTVDEEPYINSVYIHTRMYIINYMFDDVVCMCTKLNKLYDEVYKDKTVPEETLVDFRISNQGLEECLNEICIPALEEIKMHMEDIDYMGGKELEEEESSEDNSLDSIIFAKELQRRKE